jgi:CubicO group peptidase (beta-lactamase class C family)
MRRIVCALVFFVFLVATSTAWSEALAPAKPEDVGLSSERLAHIAQYFKQEADQGRLPGGVIAIARKGQLAYYESFGFRDAQDQAPMPKDAIFRLYSMTKPLVSVATMMLMEQGKLQLSDPISKFLPEFSQMQVSVAQLGPFDQTTYTIVPAERPITVQDLLRHTSGLAYGYLTGNKVVHDAQVQAGMVDKLGDEVAIRDLSPADEVTHLAKIPLVHQPGTVWEYSLASDVLGRVVEKVSGQRLSEYLDQHLFKPLKMTDAGFSVPPEKISRLAQALPADPVTRKPIVLADVSKQPANDSGGAGGVSTAIDYLRFAQMLLDDGKLDDTRIVSRTTVSLMTSDQLGSIAQRSGGGELLLQTPGYTFGLGFAVREAPGIAGTPGSVGEFTWGGAAGTYFWVDPKEKLVGVLMTQAPGPSRRFYRRQIMQLVYQAIVD